MTLMLDHVMRFKIIKESNKKARLQLIFLFVVRRAYTPRRFALIRDIILTSVIMNSSDVVMNCYECKNS